MADQAVSPFNPVTGEPRTIHTESRTIGESVQKNELSPQAIKALAQQRRAEADQLDAMVGSAPIAAQPTADELAANLASQEQSARVVAKDDAPRAKSFGRGNIDLNDRPIINNPDGSISTVYSMTFGPEKDGKYVLVPGVRRGLDRQMTKDEAYDWYKKTGEHLGKFKSTKEADEYASQLHEDQAVQYQPELNQDVSWGAAPQPAIPETPRFTSQQLNQSIDATRPVTAAAQKDENAADEAATRQRLLEQELAAREALAKQVADMQAKWQADLDKASAEYAKTASLSREQVTPLMRLAAGLGAMGATLGRTPNFAGDAIQKEMDRALEEKKALMHSGLQKLEMLKAGPAQIEKFRERAMADILAKQKAELGLMEAASAKMMSRFPQSADALREQMAKAKAGFDKEYAQYIGTRTARQFTKDAPRVTDTSALGGAGSRKTESEQKLNLLGESMKAELASIRKGVPLDSGDLDQVQKDTLASEAADKASESGQIASGGVGLGRRVGLVSKSRYQNLAPAKQKTLNAWDNAIEKYARVLTGAGMPAEEARRMSRQNGPVAGDTPDVIEFKLQRLEREADRMIGLSKNAAATMAGGPSDLPRAKTTYTPQETDALEWARDNPGPKADAIKAKIRKDKGIK